MLAVIDTNVLVSAQFWHGAPHLLFNHVRDGNVKMISSPALLAEFAEVIRRPKFADILIRTGRTCAGILTDVRRLAVLMEPQPLPVPVCRDVDDDAILALAVAARAQIIVTGDRDLLTLGVFAEIPIITPAQALDQMSELLR